MEVLRKLGVPYNDDMIQNSVSDGVTQNSADRDSDGLMKRYGKKINIRDFDGNKDKVSEMDALIAYLQSLGTMVDFSKFEPANNQKLPKTENKPQK
jgi:cytochrome c oxidase cbb3-type subunit 2